MNNNLVIGAWLVTPDQNKLTLESTDYFVEPLAMAVLVYFAENPGKVVSVNELVDSVWNGRVVGDHAVYRIINQIRKILSEDAGTAYITTIRKKGYQLNQPVSRVAVEEDQATAVPDLETFDSSPTSKKTFGKFLIWVLLAIVLAGVVLVVTKLRESAHFRSITMFDQVKPFSVLKGIEKDPVFSPNGLHIGYSHMGSNDRYFKLYVQSVDGESPIQITNGMGNDFSPSWSPDGEQIVFVRHTEKHCQIMIVSAFSSDASLREVAECHAGGIANEVAWGKKDYIYYTDSTSEVDPSKIYKFSLKTSKKEQLTNPQSGKSKGDIHMALTHDESYIAFTRDIDWGSTQVKIMDLRTREVTDLFVLAAWRKALTWSPDGQVLYYIEDNNDINAYSIAKGFHKKVFENSDTLHSINSHPSEEKLVVMSGETGVDIWGTYLNSDQPETAFIESSELDLYPESANLSVDIGFISLRSGEPQVWIKSAEGREYQLTSFTDNRAIQRIRWSPDDAHILASSLNELYLINVASKDYTVIWRCHSSCRTETASWSADGKSVYFASDMDGDWQIYQKTLDSNSPPIQITERGGYSPELTDGEQLLYFKYHEDGIWKMDLNSKLETKLLSDTNVYAYDTLYARDGGFYYASVSDSGNTLKFYDLENGQVRSLQTIANPLIDISIAGDGDLILYPKLLNEETEVKIIRKSQ